MTAQPAPSSAAHPIVIASAARTAIGSFQGALGPLSAVELGTLAVKEAVARAGVAPETVEQILMGCVLPAGLGQAPARQAALKAGLPESVAATTINKMCGSGMQALILAHDTLAAGHAGIVVAGGMESMTNAPYLLPKHRGGARMGHDRVLDHMFFDGLEDAYEPGRAMGTFADAAARHWQLTRAAQDDYAIASVERARAAAQAGAFQAEIVPVTVTTRKGAETVALDEQPGRSDTAKIPTLKPAFAADGTVTAASSSSISDGASALVLTSAAVAERQGLPVLARIVAHAVHAEAPARFVHAPVPAIRKVLERAGWSLDQVDLVEINEAFAVVPMIAMKELGIAHDRLNVNGGACALGHPIGASGARIVTTLLYALRARGGKRGVAGICIGGGEATALALELV